MADKGQEAKGYYGTAGSTANNLIGIVKTSKYGVENEPVVEKFRDEKVVNTELGTQTYPTSMTIKRKPSDAAYIALKAAAVNQTPIALKFLQKLGSAENLDADFVISKFTPTDEDVDVIQKVDIEMAVNTNLRQPIFS